MEIEIQGFTDITSDFNFIQKNIDNCFWLNLIFSVKIAIQATGIYLNIYPIFYKQIVIKNSSGTQVNISNFSILPDSKVSLILDLFCF